MNVFDEIKESISNVVEILKTTKQSKRWKMFAFGATVNHCIECILLCGRIFEIKDLPEIPQHFGCKCSLTWLKAVDVGKATNKGINGADVWIKYYNQLPDYYITKEEAKYLGWKPILGNLDKVAKGKMIGGNRFMDRDGRLPMAIGRIWYECDINYQGGYRNNFRIIYSNDGLMFRTDNHYLTFVAIE